MCTHLQYQRFGTIGTKVVRPLSIWITASRGVKLSVNFLSRFVLLIFLRKKNVFNKFGLVLVTWNIKIIFNHSKVLSILCQVVRSWIGYMSILPDCLGLAWVWSLSCFHPSRYSDSISPETIYHPSLSTVLLTRQSRMQSSLPSSTWWVYSDIHGTSFCFLAFVFFTFLLFRFMLGCCSGMSPCASSTAESSSSLQ